MRVANIQTKNMFIEQIGNNSQRLEKAQTQMATGQRMLIPSEDPIGAINSIYQRTQLHQTEQYQKNLRESKGAIDISHDTMSHVVDVLQRTRELAVQSANGIYGKEEREYVAMEVEEMIKEVVQSANASQEDRFVFSGTELKTKPFRDFLSSANNAGRPLIQRVEYQGSQREHTVEIGRGDEAPTAIAGSEAFWGQAHTVVALKDSRSFIAEQDSKIRIDGQEVQIKTGDNLEVIIGKINQNVASATAFTRELPTGELVLGLESNSPHHLQIDDVEGGRVMRDLGIVAEGNPGNLPGTNIHPNTLESGGSIFDVLIRFRDSLLNNNTENIGGRDLGGISESLGNVLRSQSKLSAVQTRLASVEKKLSRDNELTTERLSKNEDMDMATATINFSQLENIHRLSLMTASRLIQPTLMDYLH